MSSSWIHTLLPASPFRFSSFPASFISTWEPMCHRGQLEPTVLSSCFRASPALSPVPPVSRVPATAETQPHSTQCSRNAGAVGELRKIQDWGITGKWLFSWRDTHKEKSIKHKATVLGVSEETQPCCCLAPSENSQ